MTAGRRTLVTGAAGFVGSHLVARLVAGGGRVRALRRSGVLDRRARVAVAEAGPFGGTCVNAGCVPKKLLVYGAELAYDLDDDGVFNVDDFAADTQVTDANGNGLIDPQDLIVAFSDATDADGNGYVDDIAGWNFLDDDNDPFDEVQYGHGTGEARDSTAEADNGGDLGTCPNCMVLPVRVGDSFIADGNLFAQGVVFAVDSGAHIVQVDERRADDLFDADDAVGALADLAGERDGIGAQGVHLPVSGDDRDARHAQAPYLVRRPACAIASARAKSIRLCRLSRSRPVSVRIRSARYLSVLW